MELKLRAYFSPLARTDDDDARNIGAALNHLGYFTPDPKTGMIPFDPGHRFFDDIRKFQSDHGLFPDGVLRPGGATEKEINAALKENESSERSYIWRTVKDGKCRPAHAAREGRLFKWSEKIPSGAPGEDYNCRCWAEPYFVSYEAPPLPARKPQVFSEQPMAENLYPDAVTPVYPVETLLGILTGSKAALTAANLYRDIGTKRVEALGKPEKEQSSKKPEEPKNPETESRIKIKAERSQLQSKYKHSKIFGLPKNQNNQTLKEFEKRLEDFINAEDTIKIEGTYNKMEEVIHYYDPETKLNVTTDRFGNYRSGPWELTEKQTENLLRSGNLGGN